MLAKMLMDERGLTHPKGTRSEKAPTSIKFKILETLAEKVEEIKVLKLNRKLLISSETKIS